MALTTSSDPTALLSTALEKLLFLESRLEAAEASREQVRAEAERQRDLARRARKDLAAWQERATRAEVTAEGSAREATLLRRELESARATLQELSTPGELLMRLNEAESRLERQAAEREAWLDRMAAIDRLQSADDGLDLGSFIAELRAELIALRRGETRTRATVSQPPPALVAETLLENTPAPPIDADALLEMARLTRPEKTLARLCAIDLGSESPAVRRRAVERLHEAGVSALDPLVQSKLDGESDPGVRLAMVRLIETTSAASADLALRRALSDPDPRVRAGAVDGLAKRGGDGLAMALRDPDPAVRRRALTRLPRTSETIDALADALRDEDASVRKVAALGLAARPGEEAVALLRVAAKSADETVQQIALGSLDRRGAPLEAPEPPPEVVDEMSVMPPPVVVAPAAVDAPPDEMGADADPYLMGLVLDDIRATLRGRTPEELVERTFYTPSEVASAIEALLADGALVWRGPKLYLP